MTMAKATILAIGIIVGAFLIGGRYTVVISSSAVAKDVPYQTGVFIVDRFSGAVVGCTSAACRAMVSFSH